MKNFDTRVYSIADFLEWRDASLLNLSPDFQRRAVWSRKAKSYLVDTILRQKPIPKLIISQELQKNRNVRVVVDGQQRLRAIFEFIDGDFSVSRAHNPELANATFDSLDSDQRTSFLKYELGVDLLFDARYEEILDIFARVNTYTVTLKKQERLNAQYLGFFKQAAYRLGFRYVRYWLDGSVMTRDSVNRMGEAEMASDLLVSFLEAVQTNKSVESYYKKYEDEEGDLQRAEERFDRVMSYVGAIYPPKELANTNWRRGVLFYTLFTTIAQLLYGLKGPDEEVRAKLKKTDVGKLRVQLDEISAQWASVGTDYDTSDFDKRLVEFVRLSRRATTDTTSRVGRVNYLGRRLAEALKS